jgi:hypothetical protein
MKDINSILRDFALLVWIVPLAFGLGSSRTDIANLQQQVKQLQEFIHADGN